jgi:hypothetical protein
MTFTIGVGCFDPNSALMMDKAIETDNSKLSLPLLSDGKCGVLVAGVPLTVNDILDDEGKMLVVGGLLPNGLPFWTHMTPEFARSHLEEI